MYLVCLKSIDDFHIIKEDLIEVALILQYMIHVDTGTDMKIKELSHDIDNIISSTENIITEYESKELDEVEISPWEKFNLDLDKYRDELAN